MPSFELNNKPKKLNLTQINCSTQYNHRKAKSNQQVCSHVWALHCAQLLYTIRHRTDLIIFPLTLQTITIALMMSI